MPKLNDEIDDLFKLPLTDFINARKALTARLKKGGMANEAESVKALAKPSISAWAVNQLYWQHREAFDELLATGQRFRKAQAGGQIVNMREALEARRDALSHLSDLATELLRDAGSNPSLDTLRRIATTLEAISASAPSELPTLGRLIADIDPPGFAAFGSFVPATATPKRATETLATSSKESSVSAAAKTQPQQKAATNLSEKETRQAKIDAAKAMLQETRQSLSGARAAVKSLESAHKKADAAANEAIKQKRDAEERFKKAVAASTEANVRAQNVKIELAKANKRWEDAKRAAESATKELEAAFREAPRT